MSRRRRWRLFAYRLLSFFFIEGIAAQVAAHASPPPSASKHRRCACARMRTLRIHPHKHVLLLSYAKQNGMTRASGETRCRYDVRARDVTALACECVWGGGRMGAWCGGR